MLPICEYSYISIGWKIKIASSLQKYHCFCLTSEMTVPIQFNRNLINPEISIHYGSGTSIALVLWRNR